METTLLFTAAFTLAQLYWLFVLILPLAGVAGWQYWSAWRPVGIILWIVLVIIGLALFGMPFATSK